MYGKKEKVVCKYGGGFAVRNLTLNKIQSGNSLTECLLSMHLDTPDRLLLCIYVPTLMAPDDIKDSFCHFCVEKCKDYSKLV